MLDEIVPGCHYRRRDGEEVVAMEFDGYQRDYWIRVRLVDKSIDDGRYRWRLNGQGPEDLFKSYRKMIAGTVPQYIGDHTNKPDPLDLVECIHFGESPPTQLELF